MNDAAKLKESLTFMADVEHQLKGLGARIGNDYYDYDEDDIKRQVHHLAEQIDYKLRLLRQQ